MPYNYYQAYPYFQPQQQSGMLWVGNEQEAYAYPLAPNNAVALWDSGKPTVYIKQADASGKPVVKIMDYTERTSGQPESAPEYATKAEIESLLKEIESIKNEFKTVKKELRKRAIDDDDA